MPLVNMIHPGLQKHERTIYVNGQNRQDNIKLLFFCLPKDSKITNYEFTPITKGISTPTEADPGQPVFQDMLPVAESDMAILNSTY